jgi:hypothetical protein
MTVRLVRGVELSDGVNGSCKAHDRIERNAKIRRRCALSVLQRLVLRPHQ